ncbi:hypothetical protein P7K49_028494 [Saguinus oedipus]|uniref:Uncharacterized protein n=1 Tax=Saguinus oedipus TaxID=9490 RepID=A0ABQ9U4I1_SAGOE|nr:hypothetical protein P7K49_028494 [Saguinus oedipus]
MPRARGHGAVADTLPPQRAWSSEARDSRAETHLGGEKPGTVGEQGVVTLVFRAIGGGDLRSQEELSRQARQPGSAFQESAACAQEADIQGLEEERGEMAWRLGRAAGAEGCQGTGPYAMDSGAFTVVLHIPDSSAGCEGLNRGQSGNGEA